MVEQMNIFRNELQLWLLLCLIFYSNFNYSLLTNTSTKHETNEYMYICMYKMYKICLHKPNHKLSPIISSKTITHHIYSTNQGATFFFSFEMNPMKQKITVGCRFSRIAYPKLATPRIASALYTKNLKNDENVLLNLG